MTARPESNAVFGAAFAVALWIAGGAFWLISTGVQGLTEGDVTSWEVFKATSGTFVLLSVLVRQAKQ